MTETDVIGEVSHFVWEQELKFGRVHHPADIQKESIDISTVSSRVKIQVHADSGLFVTIGYFARLPCCLQFLTKITLTGD